MHFTIMDFPKEVSFAFSAYGDEVVAFIVIGPFGARRFSVLLAWVIE
jgi:hypothetical protein